MMVSKKKLNAVGWYQVLRLYAPPFLMRLIVELYSTVQYSTTKHHESTVPRPRSFYLKSVQVD
jgi:hypothetical protein